jgi:hypothetical protein
MKSFLATQVIARQNRVPWSRRVVGRPVENASGSFGSLRRPHHRVVLFHFYDSDDEPQSGSVSPLVLVAFAAAPVWLIAMGFVMRKKFFAQSAEALCADPQKALNRWRAANLIGFTFAMNPTVFGVALKFFGTSWLVSGIFFAVGLGLLVLWRPRSNLGFPTTDGNA